MNNKLTIIHPKAFSSLMKLQRLYLSKNLLKEVPANMPKSLQELRIHENAITKIKKSSFQGMSNVIVMGEEKQSPPLWNRMTSLMEPDNLPHGNSLFDSHGLCLFLLLKRT